MIKNKALIDKTIKLRKEMNDPVKEFATRNKDSPLNNWTEFQTYSPALFNLILVTNIDGVKLKFKHTILTVNGRHKNN